MTYVPFAAVTGDASSEADTPLILLHLLTTAYGTCATY
jgi:hypothetical protein